MLALKHIFGFRRRKDLFWVRQYAEWDLLLLIQPSLPDYFSLKTARAGRCGLGVAPKEILSLLFNPVNLKILDVYLETWLWSPLICAEKVLHGGVNILDYVNTYTFTFIFISNFFQFFAILILSLLLLLLVLP